MGKRRQRRLERQMMQATETQMQEQQEKLNVQRETLDQQKKESIIPKSNEFLIERFETREGFHTIFYPFEGYAIHEVMASLLAYRISLLKPISFSMSFNDYGFELLSDQTFSKEDFLDNNLLTKNYLKDLFNKTGRNYTGFPGKPLKSKHLQSGSQLFYNVFKDYEPDNLLYQQAIEETFEHGMESGRMIKVFENIENQSIVWRNCSQPTPFSFPIITDRIRTKLSSESVEDRIRKMSLQLEKGKI